MGVELSPMSAGQYPPKMGHPGEQSLVPPEGRVPPESTAMQLLFDLLCAL